MNPFELAMKDVQEAPIIGMRGTIREITGLCIRVADFPAAVGTMVQIGKKPDETRMRVGEVIGFDADDTLVMPLASMDGLKRGDVVASLPQLKSIGVGPHLLGRVINALGEPIDQFGAMPVQSQYPLTPPPIDPLARPVIDQPLATGVRAVDCMITLGKGQRLGVFASPGLGKSTLLGSMAKATEADVSVICMVGERGREVREFIEHTLGEAGLARSVVVCSTGDESALLRVRAALAATSIAEYFRDEGKDVLLIMDSVTRFCQAQRQIGLSRGEPPTTRGYPPSMFAMLPQLMERCGRTEQGSITGLYAVLVEGDEMTDPIADSARGILDGHILLSHKLARQGHWPAIDVLGSISRIANDITDIEHQQARAEVVKLLSSYAEVEDLVNIGAYAAGSNPEFDLAIACKPTIDQLLQQGLQEKQPEGKATLATPRGQLIALCNHIEQARQQVNQINRNMMNRQTG